MRNTLAAVLAVGLAAAGCSTDTDTSDRPFFFNNRTVQFVILDGFTGQAIGGPNMRLQFGTHTLTPEVENGIYVVRDVPYAGTGTILVSASGYADFVAVQRFNVNDYTMYRILMYPVGTVPADVTVSVYDVDGNAIDGATVVATMTNASAFVPNASITTIAPQQGILPGSLVGTTSGGQVTFSGGSLILGATYSIDVFGALDASGVFLVPSENHTIAVGEEIPEIVVFLDRPLEYPVAISANNEDGVVVASGQLIVTFPYAIELCTSDDEDHYWLNRYGDDTDADGVVAQPLGTSVGDTIGSVTSQLSADATVLTLTPVDDSANDPNNAFDPDDYLEIGYYGVEVKPQGANDTSCTSLTSVSLRGSGTVDHYVVRYDP